MRKKKSKLPKPPRIPQAEIDKLVFEALERAYDNGYHLHQEMTHAQIADDLLDYEVTLGDIEAQYLMQPIAKFIEKYEATHADDE